MRQDAARVSVDRFGRSSSAHLPAMTLGDGQSALRGGANPPVSLLTRSRPLRSSIYHDLIDITSQVSTGRLFGEPFNASASPFGFVLPLILSTLHSPLLTLSSSIPVLAFTVQHLLQKIPSAFDFIYFTYHS